MIEIVRRADLPKGDWDSFVEDHRRGWWWHTERWLDYSVVKEPEAVDLSFAVIDHGDILAVVPLLARDRQGLTDGNPGAAPLTSGRSVATLRAVHEAVQAEIDRLAHLCPLDRVAFRSGRPTASPSKPGGPWSDISWDTHVLPLKGRKESALYADLRKSYRHLIGRAGRRYQLTVLGAADPWATFDARTVHIAAAGRETRPGQTWTQMAAWQKQGHVLVALASRLGDEEHKDPRGFALVIRWKGHAYFASGATLDPDLAHALQWEVIKALLADGTETYELGWAERPGDDAKANGIAFFKAGFGGQRWRLPAVEKTYSREEQTA